MKKTDWKEALSSLYPPNPSFSENNSHAETDSTTPAKQLLRIELDKRKGKPATLITDFKGTDEALKELSKMLKLRCGAGGSQRDGEILIQGDFRQKIAQILLENGYKIKKTGF
ncbi:MAG: translation initiation factor [Prevotellaceae bacterium]|jgi:translation initiation factor 1|nr:translation initiation factor [Prevotellaceae bacterium]